MPDAMEEEKLEYLVFVYGTLKSGEPNHHWMLDTVNHKGDSIGKAETIGAGQTEVM